MTEPLTLEDLFEAYRRSPKAPVLGRGERGEAITRQDVLLRAYAQPCAFCNVVACLSTYCGPSDLYGAPRWLYTCGACRLRLVELGAAVATDEEIVYRFETWSKNQQNP